MQTKMELAIKDKTPKITRLEDKFSFQLLRLIKFYFRVLSRGFSK